jgi:hypothetical protein
MSTRVRRELEDDSRVFYMEGSAGTACLANVARCLHRAGVPKAGHTRDILLLAFRPATRPLAPGWLGGPMDTD